MLQPFFTLEHSDKTSSARAGRVRTEHGEIETPIFMPVGTQGTVKAISPRDLETAGAQIILGNTYHLYLRPGDQLIRKAGGLHKFMSWPKPILTDSGGYQVFSLADLRDLSEEGVRFKSHFDGSRHLFTPEKVIEIERNLGTDIAMVLDECTPYPCSFEYAEKSHRMTLNWAQRCSTRFNENGPVHDYRQFLFGIVQGSTYPELRKLSAEGLMQIGFDGYAIGGLAVGEPKHQLYDMTAICTEILPQNQPRYLMGVGKPEDIVAAIGLGVDMFDCVIPTRNGRNGMVFTWNGKMKYKNSEFREDFRPIDENCGCYTCRNFSRAYLRHLFNTGETLVLFLASLHNIYFYLELVREAGKAILSDRFASWRKEFYERYEKNS
ncbi:MAG TPA: tRNA guanosine(34) transglycosylase Tgt [Bacteroidetes bacterium]|nr:tRNA guanosine(34) transglycosylase Tgt [Bacteroidota bacterium]